VWEQVRKSAFCGWLERLGVIKDGESYGAFGGVSGDPILHARGGKGGDDLTEVTEKRCLVHDPDLERR